MELKNVEEMVAYIEKKFSSPIYTAKAVPADTTETVAPDEFRIIKLEYTDQFGNRRPEFDGPIRCYANGVTTV